MNKIRHLMNYTAMELVSVAPCKFSLGIYIHFVASLCRDKPISTSMCSVVNNNYRSFNTYKKIKAMKQFMAEKCGRFVQNSFVGKMQMKETLTEERLNAILASLKNRGFSFDYSV